MDIPKVTLVVQVGAPIDSKCYDKRIHRTARAGKYGRRAINLLTEWESKKFLRANSLTSYPGSANILQDKDAASKVSEAMDLVDGETRNKAFFSFVLWMKSRQKAWDLDDRTLKLMAKELALKGMNLPYVPQADESPAANLEELSDLIPRSEQVDEARYLSSYYSRYTLAKVWGFLPRIYSMCLVSYHRRLGVFCISKLHKKAM